MSEYWSGSITFTGLNTGTDWDEIIEAQMAVEEYRYNAMLSAQTSYEAKLAAVQDLQTQMTTLYQTLQDYSSVSDFLAKGATSSDETCVTVTADNDAEESSHTVVVNQLARNDIWSSDDGYAATSTVITDTDQTFSFTYGDTTYTLDVPGGTTLSEFASLINGASGNNDDVRASIINEGNAYHLQIRGMDLGADNTVTIKDTGFDAMGPDAFTNTQKAQNAQIKVDGFPSAADEWMERSANTIDDVIDGVTLQLKKATGSDGVNIDVTLDTDAMVGAVETVVGSINTVLQLLMDLRSQGTVSSSVSTSTASDSDDEDDAEDDSTSASVLASNYGIKLVQSTLKSILSTKGLGFSYYDSGSETGDLFTSLSTIGISTDADEDSETFGLLVIDYDDLEAAIKKDPNAVAELLSADVAGSTDSGDFSFGSAISGTTKAGQYDVSYRIENGEIVEAYINGNAASISGGTITGASGKDEKGLALTVNNTSDGSYTGSVSLKQGKIGQFIDTLEDMTSSKGSLQIMEDSFQDILDQYAQSISREEERLGLVESRLRSRYSGLETLLTSYDNLSSTIDSLLASLSSD
ncbi:flagellar filament capping protein FliD [Nitratidesulfovibrio sp. SRB-5]|uniref:flagellar filament capping protein FliD n=1 Tax=Nitratidesulfovibrio sp. SRB-5 TaxID=2872636 RepID=UPI0010250C67|nr:flagellar filament capping protein FliD [Nitratidesulfovibrio sp. SRB-5]MBZ2172223.1 flagellar filament capping protein FliD [Nitratidesulfovibrio sp. SRB-5]RXF76092.1 flagellar hook protein [Desulfovibrio sp. DS-1]